MRHRLVLSSSPKDRNGSQSQIGTTRSGGAPSQLRGSLDHKARGKGPATHPTFPHTLSVGEPHGPADSPGTAPR